MKIYQPHWWVLIVSLLCLSGCSSMFFYPMKQHVLNPVDLGLHYEDVEIRSDDGVRLHGWYLPAVTTEGSSAKGSVYFLHGNAENISTHILNVSWLPAQGYNVFMLDYRGYGKSDGKASLDGVVRDVRAGHQWLNEKVKIDGLPVFLMGQSLGASLAIHYAGTQRTAEDATRLMS